MLHYILQTIVFQLLFLMVYDVFLRKETFFNWNRFYLLVSAFLSIVLPFVKVDSFKTVIPERFIYTLPEVILGKSTTTAIAGQELLSDVSTVNSFYFSWSYIIYFGCVIALVLFAIKLYRLIAIACKNPKVKFEKAILIELVNSKHAFSFFNYIFLGKDINVEDKQTILNHELQHVKEKHSIDLLFFEILKILFWFNPLIYMYQKRIANLHEFIADSKAVKSSCKASYYQNLLSQVFDTQKVSFINPFFKQSLIKKRIIMLSKSKSNQIHLTKYLLLFPMVIGMLFYTSCSEKTESESEISNLEQYSYSLKLDEEMSDDVKITHQKYESFLKENKDYVSWSVIDKEAGVISYSVHAKAEKRPIGMHEIRVNSTDGASYISYFNFDGLKTEKEEYIETALIDDESLSFATINQVPVYPGCDTFLSNKDQRKCFSENVNKLVRQNFNLDLGKKLGLTGKVRIYARFIIDKEGNIETIKTRAPHPELEKEARRIVKLIPQVKAGQHEGDLVKVAFDLPITFNIQE
ncbi:M56 family metallopeptidase [uncultured Lacinutrix sp.]|uniref:M56 family metallopeptidase n=1 Tax=uncultured Lacinutrix sp. TaxID=574032 RepID=UPI0026139732|nr:M56 family metallopeptidase [uncultured Lacinutrix sp.]